MRSQKAVLKQLSTPLYGYLNALYMAFFSKNLYVDVGKRWRGWGLVYLLLLISVSIIPLSIQTIIQFKSYFKNEFTYPLTHMPLLHFKGGEVYCHESMPFKVKDSSGKVKIIIDTTGEINSIGAEYPDLMLLITKQKIFYRLPNVALYFKSLTINEAASVVKSKDLSEVNDEIFSGKKLAESKNLRFIRNIFMVAIYPTMLLCLWGFAAPLFLSLAIVAKLIAKTFLKFKVKYMAAARILTVSSSPAMYLLGIFLPFQNVIPGFFFIWVGLLVIYFIFGMKALKDSNQHLVRT